MKFASIFAAALLTATPALPAAAAVTVPPSAGFGTPVVYRTALTPDWRGSVNTTAS